MNSLRMERTFAKIKNDILGKEYSLSIVYVTSRKSRELNKKYRRKDRATNVLSFSLRPGLGELVLCPPVIRKEAKDFDKTYEEFLGFLVIHGMLHLKGIRHSSTMEKSERAYDKKYFGRNRRGLASVPRRSGRIRQGRKKS